MTRVAVLALLLLGCATSSPVNTVPAPGTFPTTPTASTSPTPASGWSELAPLGVARSEHPAVVWQGEMVVMGGLIEVGFASSGATSSVESYDPGEDRWLDLPALPAPRHHGMAAVVDDRLFFIGGYDEQGFNPVATVWELGSGAWVERAPLPEPVGAGAAVTIDQTIYVVGGTPSSPLLSYDVAADAWTPLTGPSQEREHVAAVALDGEVWAIGGRWQGTMHSSVEIYDPATDQWRDGPSLNEARSGFGAAVLDGAVMVAGGEVFDPTRALVSVERLDPGSNAWQLDQELPIGLHGNPLVALAGTVYLPSGSIEAAGVDNPGQLFALEP